MFVLILAFGSIFALMYAMKAQWVPYASPELRLSIAYNETIRLNPRTSICSTVPRFTFTQTIPIPASSPWRAVHGKFLIFKPRARFKDRDKHNREFPASARVGSLRLGTVGDNVKLFRQVVYQRHLCSCGDDADNQGYRRADNHNRGSCRQSSLTAGTSSLAYLMVSHLGFFPQIMPSMHPQQRCQNLFEPVAGTMAGSHCRPLAAKSSPRVQRPARCHLSIKSFNA
jgi:hypothetical protein